MGAQDYRKTYLAAIDVAHSDLDQIFQECEQLQLRKEQLEDVVGALEPFLRTITAASTASSHEFHQPESVQAQPVHVEPEVAKPVLRAVPAPEPVVPAAFSPMPEAILDPIQSRINRALGLAVA